MQLEENKIYHMDNRQGLLMLPEKSANLIIADPPYFEVKGDFDFVWKNFGEYLEFMEEQAKLYKRVLADNGSLFVYGHAKKIAYVQTIFDKYFNLENNITWWVYDRQTNKGVENIRCFAPVTERILFYSNYSGEKKWDDIYHDTVRQSIKPTHEYLNTITTRDDLAEKLLKSGNCKNLSSAKQNANNILKQTSAKPQFITKYQYDLICYPNKKTYEELRQEYEELRQEYEELRQEYEELRRPFNNYLKLTDVMKFSQEGHITGQYDHETVKPEKLTRALILTCSKENDLVVIPFAGSGTECAMAAKEGRRFIGFDTEKKYVDMANKRLEHHLRHPSLFSAV